MLSRYKSISEKLLLPLASKLTWIYPNILTLLGIIPQLAFFILMRNEQFYLAAIALAFSFLDMLDGLVSRLTGKSSTFGAFLDSTVDRVSDFFMIAGLYVGGLLNLELAGLLLLAAFLTSYIRARAESLAPNKKFDQGLIERTERVILVLLSSLLASNFFLVAQMIVYLLILFSIATVFQRAFAVYLNLKKP